MIKNDIYEVTIDDIGNDGEGIGHINDRQNGKSFVVFVKDTVIGDVARIRIIKVKKTYAYGRLEEIIRPSLFRCEPVCQKARSCGGCSLMHMSYEKQLEYKFNKVKACLSRIGGVDDVENIMEQPYGMETPYFYRNKMQLPVGRDRDGNFVIGFYAGHTHNVIDIEKCYIGHTVNDYIIKHMRKWLNGAASCFGEGAVADKGRGKKSGTTGKDIVYDIVYDEETHTGLVRHILTRVGFATGELMVCLVINRNALPEVLEKSLTDAVMAAVDEYNAWVEELDINANVFEDKDMSLNKNTFDGKNVHLGKQKKIVLKSICLNINKEKTNKILGDKCVAIYGQDYIEDYIGDIKFRISPLSFYQVNPVQTKAIYDKAIEYADLKGGETVWDMYCGIGTISLCLSKKAGKVYGVEIIPEAIKDAKENAAINNIKNTEFFCGKAEELVPEFYKSNNSMGAGCDVIVVDPPRKGCDARLLETIVAMSPHRLVYVSCDPATLARDIKILSEQGYKLQKAACFDAFCQSTHVETVCQLVLTTHPNIL